jgi:transposase
VHLELLPFELPGFQISRTFYNEVELVIFARAITPQAECPGCSQLSQRVHSYYQRHLKDLPVSQWQVRLELEVRRFRCLNPACPAQTFAERLTYLLPVYAQRTTRFSSAITELGIALSAQAAARVANKLKMPTSQDTILRTIKSVKLGSRATPRVLGVDDFAFRKGKTYGTLLVDLEKHRPVDLLPDRTAPTLISWLKEHKAIQIVSRDRSTEYTRAITQALPLATQVADRWHVLKNLRQSLYRVVNRHYSTLLKKSKTTSGWATHFNLDPTSPKLKLRQKRSVNEQAASQASLARRQARYQQVKEAAQAGTSQRQITRELGINRETVRQYLASESGPQRASRTNRKPSTLAPYYPQLEQRWQAGCDNAVQLWREVRLEGYKGSRMQVQRWVELRRQMPEGNAVVQEDESSVKFRLPGVKELTWLVFRDAKELNQTEQVLLTFLKEETDLEKAWDLAQRFRETLAQKDVSKFQGWLAECLKSEVAELVSFGKGLQSDQAAIEAGISSRWSNGQTEGWVNKVKLIKRQLYGRGSFELLRRKVLLAA